MNPEAVFDAELTKSNDVPGGFPRHILNNGSYCCLDRQMYRKHNTKTIGGDNL